MISFKSIYILITLSILILACQPVVKTDQMNEERLANLICQCSVPIVTYNDELRALASADNIGALTQKMSLGDQIMGTAINCITDHLEIETKNLLNERLDLLIEEQCHLEKRMAADLIQKISQFEIPSY